MMLMMQELRRLCACREAVEWASAYPDLAAAWAACERADWMLWLAVKYSGGPRSTSRKRLVLCACACARTTLQYVQSGDGRPLAAIEMAERWAKGDGITLEMVRRAVAAADAAHAAYAAANAADADAAHAARLKSLSVMADIVRQHYPTSPEAS